MKLWAPLLFFVAVFLVAMAGGLLGNWCFGCVCPMPGAPMAGTAVAEDRLDSHAWLHGRLGLTPAEEAALAGEERGFAAREEALRGRLLAANEALARTLLEERADSERVRGAVRAIHAVHGDWQVAVVEHFFRMREALPPEKGAKLLELAAEALRAHPPASPSGHAVDRGAGHGH